MRSPSPGEREPEGGAVTLIPSRGSEPALSLSKGQAQPSPLEGALFQKSGLGLTCGIIFRSPSTGSPRAGEIIYWFWDRRYFWSKAHRRRRSLFSSRFKTAKKHNVLGRMLPRFNQVNQVYAAAAQVGFAYLFVDTSERCVIHFTLF